MPVLLKNLPAAELHAALAHAGVTEIMARRVQAAALKRRPVSTTTPGLSAAMLARIGELTEDPSLALADKVVSPQDGFAKYLFTGDGPEKFEAVRIPLLHQADHPKYVACISSQAGCALKCAFCATGRMGIRRNLSTWEMVDQVAAIAMDSPHPVRGVVFMGMGEPFLNYEAVIRAARIISEPCGLAIAGKAITISTAGIVPGIRRFTAEHQPYKLIVSLTSADPATRERLMPVEKTHPTPGLMAALREYHLTTRQRVTLAWIMISGVNTRAEDARQLAALVGDLPVQLDLIDVNDPSGHFQPPGPEELRRFRDALRQHLGQPVVRRYSGGKDIQAACGMLAGGAA